MLELRGRRGEGERNLVLGAASIHKASEPETRPPWPAGAWRVRRREDPRPGPAWPWRPPRRPLARSQGASLPVRPPASTGDTPAGRSLRDGNGSWPSVRASNEAARQPFKMRNRGMIVRVTKIKSLDQGDVADLTPGPDDGPGRGSRRDQTMAPDAVLPGPMLRLMGTRDKPPL